MHKPIVSGADHLYCTSTIRGHLGSRQHLVTHRRTGLSSRSHCDDTRTKTEHGSMSTVPVCVDAQNHRQGENAETGKPTHK